MALIMGHNIHFEGVIWKTIPFTPSYLEHCFSTEGKFFSARVLLPREANLNLREVKKVVSICKTVENYGDVIFTLKPIHVI